MAKLPRVSGKEMLRFLEREGFVILRVRGSHYVLMREELDTVVPVHGNRTLAVGTLRKILRDIELRCRPMSLGSALVTSSPSCCG